MLRQELQRRGQLVIRVSGTSMLPLIPPHCELVLEHCTPADLRRGDVVAYHTHNGWVIHRIYAFTPRGRLLCKGDWRLNLDPPIEAACLIGRVRSLVRYPCPRLLWKILERIWILGLVGPVGWLVSRRRGAFLRRVLQQFGKLAWTLDRVRRRLRLKGKLKRLAGGRYQAADGSWLSLQSGHPPCLVAYSGESSAWEPLLEAVKRDLYGWGPGRLLTPAPEQSGWDWESDRVWIEFLLAEGFVVRRRGPRLHLELEF